MQTFQKYCIQLLVPFFPSLLCYSSLGFSSAFTRVHNGVFLEGKTSLSVGLLLLRQFYACFPLKIYVGGVIDFQ